MIVRRKHVYEDVDRHGNVRTYFWRGKGQRKVRILEEAGSEEFDKRYYDLLRKSAAGEFRPAPRDAPKLGTLRWLCVEYLKSEEFRQLDPWTQYNGRLIVEKIFVEPISPDAKLLFGDCPLARFDATSVCILRDRRADRPEAANDRVRRLRTIFTWAIGKPKYGITTNPARDIKPLRPKRVGGFPSWTPGDIEKFEVHFPMGSRPRLALALLFCTGGRRSDVIRLGKQHVRDGMISWRQHKGRNRSPTTITIRVLPYLQNAIESTPTGDLTFLVTGHGRPFTAMTFSNWFRRCCDEAGLPTLSAHGLRKAAATYLAERGASAHQLMAIFGWTKIAQAERYTRDAERKKLAMDGMELHRTDRDQIFPTLEQGHGSVGKKRAEN